MDPSKWKVKHDITSLTLVNATAKNILHTVPVGEQQILIGWKMTNPDDVTRNMTVQLFKEAAKTNLLKVLFTEANVAASQRRQWPQGENTSSVAKDARPPSMWMTAGTTISFDWDSGGASTGGTDADGLVVEYLTTKVRS
jgi:hypothetical protein